MVRSARLERLASARPPLARCQTLGKRTAQNKKRSRTQDPAQQARSQAVIKAAHQSYLAAAQGIVDKARQTLDTLAPQKQTETESEQTTPISAADRLRKDEIEGFIEHAVRQMDQVQRRVILGQSIPHEEKVFSLFQPHTEWSSQRQGRGADGVGGQGLHSARPAPVHLGNHQVMQHQSDEQVCVPMVEQARKRFAGLRSCSFDKGFHSPANQVALKEHLVQITLPRKGKLSRQALAAQETPEFVKARRAHSAVESAINALEVHGLDVCPDHGIEGFKRYVAWAVLARNIHSLGALLWQQEQVRLCKQKGRKQARQTSGRRPHVRPLVPAA